jgi:hypothetical protein
MQEDIIMRRLLKMRGIRAYLNVKESFSYRIMIRVIPMPKRYPWYVFGILAKYIINEQKSVSIAILLSLCQLS